MKTVLVTGATGFVGRALIADLLKNNYEVIALVRSTSKAKDVFFESNSKIKFLELDDLLLNTQTQQILSQVDFVVHLAARVHVMQETVSNPLEEFRKVNVLLTEKLLKLSKTFNIKYFIYMSSIKVNGEETKGVAFSESDEPMPADPYAVSKLEAERLVASYNCDALKTVSLRPPLIYGRDVKANFQALLKLVARGLPLPFGAINNNRSMLFLGNLTDAIICLLKKESLLSGCYLIADNESVSLRELVTLMAQAMNKKIVLLPFPVSVMKLLARCAGKSAMVSRLTESLQVNNMKLKNDLQWDVPYSLKQGLIETVKER